MQEMQVQSLGREDPLEESMATHLSIIAGIFQAIILEWIAISFSRGSSLPKD